MKHRDDSFLDHALRKINDDERWDTNRQQSIRNNVLDEIDRQETHRVSSMRHWMKRVMPVIALLLAVAISTTLYFQIAGDESTSDPGYDPSTSEPYAASGDNTDATADPDIQFSIDPGKKEEIENIRESGFHARLPQNTAEEADKTFELKNINHSDSRKNREHTYAEYRDEGNDQNMTIKQEKIKGILTQDEAIQHIKDINEGNENLQELTIHDQPAFMLMKEHTDAYASSLWVITDDYGYTITSPSLTETEMKKVAGSIDY